MYSENTAFARYYAAFGKALKKLDINHPIEGRGVAMVVGTLGCGGAERQLILTLKGLASHGVAPLHVLAVSLAHQDARYYQPHAESYGAQVRELTSDQFSQISLGKRLRLAVNQLPVEISQSSPFGVVQVLEYARALSQIRPKVAHLWMDEVNIKGGLAAVALGIPQIVLSTRNVSPEHFSYYHPYMREGYLWLAKQPNVTIINNSKAGAASYTEWLGLPSQSIKVIHNALDYESIPTDIHMCRDAFRVKLGIPNLAFVIGGVLRLSDEKRPLLWLQVASQVQNQIPGCRFVLVGSGPLEQEVKQKIIELNLSETIHLIERTDDVFEIMCAVDLFLLTSQEEGLPNVLLEAQSIGTPVVTTEAGGAAEAVLCGKSGWVIKEDSSATIAAAVIKVFSDVSWRENAKLEGMAFVKNKFGLHRMIQKTLETYSGIINLEEM